MNSKAPLNRLLYISQMLQSLVKKRYFILWFLFFIGFMIINIFIQIWNIDIYTETLTIKQQDIKWYKETDRTEFETLVFNSNLDLLEEHIIPSLFENASVSSIETIEDLSIWEEKQRSDWNFTKDYDGWELFDGEKIIEKKTKLKWFFNADKFNDFMAFVLQKAWYTPEEWEENNYRLIFDDMWEKDQEFANLYSDIMDDINKMYSWYRVTINWTQYIFLIIKTPGELLDLDLRKERFISKLEELIDKFYKKMLDIYKIKSNEIAQLASSEWKGYKYLLKYQAKINQTIEKLKDHALSKDRSILIINLVGKDLWWKDKSFMKKYLSSPTFVNDIFYYYLVN